MRLSKRRRKVAMIIVAIAGFAVLLSSLLPAFIYF